MKAYLLLAFVSLLFINATIDSDKFVGKWQPLPNSNIPTTFILTIKKAGTYYVMLSSEKPDEPIALQYDSKTKIMSGRLDGIHFRIGYSPKLDNILFAPESGDRVQFKRIK